MKNLKLSRKSYLLMGIALIAFVSFGFTRFSHNGVKQNTIPVYSLNMKPASSAHFKCGDGKCGKAEKTTQEKSKKKESAKCGDGKCGDAKAGDKSTKKQDAKCGNGKCGDGKSKTTKAKKTKTGNEAKCGK